MLSDVRGRDMSAEDFSFESKEDARMLRHWDYNHNNYQNDPDWDPWAVCEPDAFYAEFRQLKYHVLTYQEYMLFYETLMKLREEGGYIATYCQPNWRDIIKGAVCVAAPTQPICSPDLNVCVGKIFDKLRNTCNTHSIYGANWWSDDSSTTAEQEEGLYCLCNGADADDFTNACAFFESQRLENDNADFKFKLKELDLTMYEHLVQQSIYGKPTKYSSTFATDGWYNTPDSWDYSTATRTDVVDIWFNNEENPKCPVDLNKGTQNSFPSTR